MPESSETSQSTKKDKALIYLTWIGIGFYYFLLTAYVTYPDIFVLKNGGFGGDIYSEMRSLAWNWEALKSPKLSINDANIFYPAKNTQAFSQITFGLLPIYGPIYEVTGNINLAYNLTCFISFILSGLFMHILVKYLLNNHSAAFVAGTIFLANPLRMVYLSLVALVAMQWMPLAVLYLDKFIKKYSYKNILLFTFFFWLQFISGFYSGYATVIICILYIISSLFMKRIKINKSLLKHCTIFILFCLFVFVTIGLSFIEARQDRTIKTNLDVIYSFSPDFPRDYLSVYWGNKIYGRYLGFIRTEPLVPLFSGIILPLFVITGLIIKVKDPILKTIRTNFRLITLIGFLLTFGPFLKYKGALTMIPMPYLLIMEIIPGFSSLRVPSRLIYIFLFGGAILGALVYYILNKYIKKTLYKRIFLVILIILLMIEYTNDAHLSSIQPYSKVPEVYEWVKNNDIKGGILELPVEKGNLKNEAIYSYFSAYHLKPIVNGYGAYYPKSHNWLIEQALLLPSQKAIRTLRALDIRTIIWHGNMIEWVDSSKLENKFKELGFQKLNNNEDRWLNKDKVFNGYTLEVNRGLLDWLNSKNYYGIVGNLELLWYIHINEIKIENNKLPINSITLVRGDYRNQINTNNSIYEDYDKYIGYMKQVTKNANIDDKYKDYQYIMLNNVVKDFILKYNQDNPFLKLDKANLSKLGIKKIHDFGSDSVYIISGEEKTTKKLKLTPVAINIPLSCKSNAIMLVAKATEGTLWVNNNVNQLIKTDVIWRKIGTKNSIKSVSKIYLPPVLFDNEYKFHINLAVPEKAGLYNVEIIPDNDQINKIIMNVYIVCQ